jgi:lysozyme family protein
VSQFPEALSFVLDNEDRNRLYAVVPDPGGAAISGVNSRYWPTAYDHIYRLPQGQRALAVANFYQTEFWNVMRLGGIESQDLANRVLDEGVNAGPYTATKMLQEAVNAFNAEKLQVDGILGSKSLDAINAADHENLLAMFRSLRKQRYQKIAADNPASAKYLPAWEARAEA